MNWLKKEKSSPGPTPSSLTREISSPSKRHKARPLTKADVTTHESLYYWRQQYEVRRVAQHDDPNPPISSPTHLLNPSTHTKTRN